VREIRMHPYFFPTGVNGAPSFLPGGNPTRECKAYWMDIRRALLRKPVDRIGFGGYLHLVENHPDFIDYVRGLAVEFRRLKSLHVAGNPYTAPLKVAFLTAWGQQRAWGCCGHFNRNNYYNEAMESISGLPVETTFINFEDIIRFGIPADIDVIINAGNEGDAWSGGEYWSRPEIITQLSNWVGRGGGLIGIGEPTAAPVDAQAFRLAQVFGVDRTVPAVRNQTPFATRECNEEHFITAGLPIGTSLGKEIDAVRPISPEVIILRCGLSTVQIAVNQFGRGRAVYMSGHRFSPELVRLLHRTLFWAAGKEADFSAWTTTNVHTECAWYPGSACLVVVNNSAEPQKTSVRTAGGEKLDFQLEPGETRFHELKA